MMCQNYNQQDYNMKGKSNNINSNNNNNKINNNNNINNINNKKQQPICHCGRFLISQSTPRILVYIKSNPNDITNPSSLYIFRQQYGIQQYFTSLSTKAPFQFCLSSSGQFLGYTLNNGTNINIYNIKQKKLYCVLYAGMASRQILKMNFFYATIQGKLTLCLGMIRKRQQSLGTMHVFKIQMKTPTIMIESQYKRTINLFERTMKDYQITSKLIAPDFYIYQNILYVVSICGIVQEAINFQKGYIKDKKNIEDIYARWEEDQNKYQYQQNQ